MYLYGILMHSYGVPIGLLCVRLYLYRILMCPYVVPIGFLYVPMSPYGVFYGVLIGSLCAP